MYIKVGKRRKNFINFITIYSYFKLLVKECFSIIF